MKLIETNEKLQNQIKKYDFEENLELYSNTDEKSDENIFLCTECDLK